MPQTKRGWKILRSTEEKETRYSSAVQFNTMITMEKFNGEKFERELT